MDLQRSRNRLDTLHRQFWHEPLFDGSTVIFALAVLIAALMAAAR